MTKFRVSAAFAAFLLLMVAAGCRGFFVNPTLTGITVTCPTCSSTASPNLTSSGSGSTAKLIATGNYDDSSTKNLTGSVNWTSADDTQVSVNNTNDKGRITAVAASTTSAVTITAATTDGVTTGSIPVTIGLAANTVTCITGCTNGNTLSIGSGVTSITLSSTIASNWTGNAPTIMSVSGTGTTGTATLVGTATGDVTITATPSTSGSGAVGSLVIHVTN